MPMGSSRVGGPATQKGATESGGPEGGNFRLLRKHSSGDFLQQRAVYRARVIARRRLVREVGSVKKGGGLRAPTALELD